MNAHIAAIFAGELARFLGARLIVFFALSPMMRFQQKDPLPINPEGVMQKKLDELAHEMRNRFGVSVTRLLKPGFPEDEIAALAKRLDARLVITGTKSESDKKEDLGNVAKALRSQNEFPVACIPAVASSAFSQMLAELEQNRERYCNDAGGKLLEKLMIQHVAGELISQKSSD